MTLLDDHDGAVAPIVHAYLVQRFPAAGSITNETPLLEGGIIDSLGFLELMTFLSERFDIALDDTHFEPDNISTPAALVRFVEAHAADVR
ncbi:acyl carrier protein (plasmid) [Rhizobium sp. NIBRBAC000502774]|nr:acyl carrier protein [Rhizobium sp. NIBRBAC000502774]